MQENYIARMNQAITHKRYFVNIIQKLHEQQNQRNLLEEVFEKKSMINVNILDYGCGGGLLTSVVAKECPGAKVMGYDLSLDMIEIARERFSETNLQFTADIRCLKNHSYDYIVLSSILHEVFSQFDNLFVITTFLNSLQTYLKPGGYIISRDNYVFDSTGKDIMEMHFTTLNMANRAIKFMEEIQRLAPRKSAIYYGIISIDTKKQVIIGSERGVKEFLNKMTWGEESLLRESQESLFCFSSQDWKTMIPQSYNIIAQYNYVDSSYLSYLRDIVEIPKNFPTHQWTILQLLSPHV